MNYQLELFGFEKPLLSQIDASSLIGPGLLTHADYNASAHYAKNMALRTTRDVELIHPWVLFKRDRFLCTWCGCPINRYTKLGPDAGTIDHVCPRGKGGSHRYTNCVTSCRSCNGAKADLTLDELVEVGLRIIRQFPPDAGFDVHQQPLIRRRLIGAGALNAGWFRDWSRNSGFKLSREVGLYRYLPEIATP